MKSKSTAWIIVFLVLLTLFAYWDVRNAGFVNFDDDLYVTGNDRVKSGLTIDNIAWAFQIRHTEDNAHFHPFTWISHMADCELFGLSPAGHHLVNLLLHIFNTGFLFLVFRKMTGASLESAIVAALFAIHPVNVDSVAWIAQRKNLLSTFFWILSIMAYAEYAIHGKTRNYLITFMLFLSGLLTKPMLVTLPFTLLLLDLWPLNRIRIDFERNHQQSEFKTISYRIMMLVIEKAPFFILSFGFVILSSISQKGYGEVVSLEDVPLSLRIGNALISYIAYIKNALAPMELSVFYPYPKSAPLLWTCLSACILIGVSAAAIRSIRKSPYFFIGWCWFLGTLVPVIGLMQTGLWPALADRWAYVPYIGLFIIIAFGCRDILRNFEFGGMIYIVAFCVIITILAGVTRIQTGYWKNSGTLFSHAVEVTENNYVAHNNLGLYLSGPEAEKHFKAALEIKPDFYKAHNNLGMALYEQKKLNRAVFHFQKAIELKPDYKTAYNNLAVALSEMDRFDEARDYFNKVLEIDPGYAGARLSFGAALAKHELYSQAKIQFNKALEINPDFAEAYHNLGVLLKDQGDMMDAIRNFNEAVRIDPTYRNAQLNREDAFAALGMTEQAVAAAVEGLERNPDDYGLNRYLGNVYRSGGKLSEAVSFYKKALETGYPQPKTLSELGIAYAMRGAYDDALVAFKSVIEIKPGDALACYHIACVHALKNDPESAVQWLKRSLENGFKGMKIIETDRRLDNIRNSAEFKRFMSSIKRDESP